jgi:hypothetical protein
MNRHLPDPNPARVLRVAAAYLDRNGWIQRDMFADDPVPEPAACAMGAITYAVTGRLINVFNRYSVASLREYDVVDATAFALADDLCRSGRIPFVVDPVMEVECWNDAPGRTEVDVYQAMLWAADWYEHGRVSQ